jgi:MoxR-like ATPase
MPVDVEQIFKAVVGRRKEILLILSALQAGKNIFLEGPPGTSKSTILNAISDYMGNGCCLVTGNNDLTTSKLIGYFDPAETLSRGYDPKNFIPGPLVSAMQEGKYLYIEEFNRLPDETTNVFVTVLSEKKLLVPRFGVVETSADFRIIAALNPLDDIGINRISRALKDRFSSISMDYQSKDEEIEVVRRRTGYRTDELIEFAVNMARETRKHPEIKLGSSVRGSIDMIDIYRKTLDIQGRDMNEGGTDYELLLDSAVMALRSKIWVFETSEKKPEDLIREIFFDLQKKKL